MEFINKWTISRDPSGVWVASASGYSWEHQTLAINKQPGSRSPCYLSVYLKQKSRRQAWGSVTTTGGIWEGGKHCHSDMWRVSLRTSVRSHTDNNMLYSWRCVLESWGGYLVVSIVCARVSLLSWQLDCWCGLGCQIPFPPLTVASPPPLPELCCLSLVVHVYKTLKFFKYPPFEIVPNLTPHPCLFLCYVNIIELASILI